MNKMILYVLHLNWCLRSRNYQAVNGEKALGECLSFGDVSSHLIDEEDCFSGFPWRPGKSQQGYLWEEVLIGLLPKRLQVELARLGHRHRVLVRLLETRRT